MIAEERKDQDVSGKYIEKLQASIPTGAKNTYIWKSSYGICKICRHAVGKK
jgi:hypothetical protein